MFVILQKYDFSSKSQQKLINIFVSDWCLWYCKSTIFQANHNYVENNIKFFLMFVILQKYDFSSKSQPRNTPRFWTSGCLWYCKSTIFQANHNRSDVSRPPTIDVCDTAKVRFFKQITTVTILRIGWLWCLWYCKSTIFQANHNPIAVNSNASLDVCDTAKVRFFKQITTTLANFFQCSVMFVILQKYDFSSKSQP